MRVIFDRISVVSGTAAGTGLPVGTHAKTGTAQYTSAGHLDYDAWLMGYRGDIAFAVVVQNSGGVNGGPLDGPLMASFEKERDRLDTMMSNRGAGARISDAAGTASAGPVRQVSNR